MYSSSNGEHLKGLDPPVRVKKRGTRQHKLAAHGAGGSHHHDNTCSSTNLPEGTAPQGKPRGSRQHKTASHFDQSTHLLEAVSQGKIRVVRRLLNSKTDPNYQGGAQQVSPLMVACELEEEEVREGIMDLLLTHKETNVNLQDCSGKTALMRAAVRPDLTTLTRLVECGADLELTDSAGNIALSLAAEVGSEECVRALVRVGGKRGVAIDHQNLQGVTPLLMAAQEGHLEVCRVLVQGGSSLTKRDLEHFMKPLDWMEQWGYHTSQELEFLRPSGKKKDYYREQRMKKGIKSLTDYLTSPVENLDGTHSPNVFMMRRNVPAPHSVSLQFPVLNGDTGGVTPSKSMFDVPVSTEKKLVPPPQNKDFPLSERRRVSVSFPSVASVKTDLYKSSYLTKREMRRNSVSDGYHKGALDPLAPPTNPSQQFSSTRLPPINK